MWEKIMEAGTGVYILWGIGAIGLLLHIMISMYLNSMVRASKDMSTTRKKSLGVIRRKIENRKTLCVESGSKEAFVDKNVYSMKWLGFPIRMWEGLGKLCCYVVLMAVAGAFLYYDVDWRGSPDMIYFLATAGFVCAFLLSIQNIFLLRNKVELLKANIWDFAVTTRKVETDVGVVTEYVTGDKKEQSVEASKEEVKEEVVDNEEILNSFLKEFFA